MPKQPTTQAEQLLPHNTEAEESLLGALLIDPDAIIKVAPIIEAKDFFVERNGWIYDAIRDLAERGEPSDLVVLSDELDRRGKLYELGGAARLMDLQNIVPSSVHAESYARIIERTAKLRRLIEAASQIAVIAYEDQSDVDEIYNRSLELIQEAKGVKNQNNVKRLHQVVAEVYDNIEWQLQNRGQSTGVATGLADLDQLLNGGLQNGELITIAADTGGGKSALVATMAYNVGLRGKRVVYFNYEMSSLQIGRRFAAMDSGINLSAISSANIHDDQWPLFLRSLNRLNEIDVFVVNAAGMTVHDIKNKCAELEADGGIDLIIVDYIQLVTPSRGRKGGNRENDVAGISRDLKLLAGELYKPIIALSQINRDAPKRPDKRPRLGDLRESGAIAQDSDVVIMVYRDEMYNEDTEFPNIAELLIEKFRNGATGKVDTFYKKTTTQFLDLAMSRPSIDY